MSTSISSSTPNSTADGKKSSAKKNRAARRWVTVISTLALIFLLFLIIRIQGYVSGSEFSPSHFQQRDFTFYEIPLIHIQITPIKRSGSTPGTATYLRQKGLVTTPRSRAPVDWQLVSISRGVTGTTPADAFLLIEQFNMESGGNEYWRQWSIDHPQNASVLWPVVQKLAKRELYILMPALFELAQLEQTPAELQTAIDNHLSQQYRHLVADMQAADRDDLASQLLTEARGDYPDDAELQQLRLSPSQ